MKEEDKVRELRMDWGNAEVEETVKRAKEKEAWAMVVKALCLAKAKAARTKATAIKAESYWDIANTEVEAAKAWVIVAEAKAAKMRNELAELAE